MRALQDSWPLRLGRSIEEILFDSVAYIHSSAFTRLVYTALSLLLGRFVVELREIDPRVLCRRRCIRRVVNLRS